MSRDPIVERVLSFASSDSSVSSLVMRSDAIRPPRPPRPPRWEDSRVLLLRLGPPAGLLLPASADGVFRLTPADLDCPLASPEDDPSMSRLSALRLSMSTSEESASGDLHCSSGGILGSVAGGEDLEGVEAVSGVSEVVVVVVGGSVAGMFEAALMTG